jgi:hypothetical protein
MSAASTAAVKTAPAATVEASAASAAMPTTSALREC